MAADYPTRVDIVPWGWFEHAVGSWTLTRLHQAALAEGYGYTGGTVAVNNEIGWKVALKAGTWDLVAVLRTQNNLADATMKLDSTTIGTIVGYSAGATNNVVSTIAGFTVPADGVYTLKAVMASRNGSSGGWFSPMFGHITLQRTGA